MRVLDIRFQGHEHSIGTLEHEGVIVDPGPESCSAALAEALGDTEVRAVLLTHIHLDHAGGAGRVIERFPDARVYVHAKGARHVIDPSKLVASATRIYGDDMERLWGEIVPVDADKVTILDGDEGPVLDGWSFRYTPGHAVHHVAFKHEESGLVHCGDVAGVRIGDGPAVAPTPPPDIDLGLWRASLARIEAWEPSQLCLTHFGLQADVAAHLAQIRSNLDLVERASQGTTEDEYRAWVHDWLVREAPDADLEAYELANPAAMQFAGLARYWQKQAEGAA